MNSNGGTTLYQQLIEVTDTYLGPASERFVNRQIQNHLQKPPQKITPRDLPSLIKWIRITISVLTEDARLVSDYVAELEALYGTVNRRKR